MPDEPALPSEGPDGPAGFSQLARQKRRGPLGELFGFAMQNKKWWLIPILLVMLAAGALIVLGGTGAAPFIYTLF